MPLFRNALDEIASSAGARHALRTPSPSPINVILESNTLLQFLKPDLFLMVLHPGKTDFKDSAQLQLDRASAFVLREPLPSSTGTKDTTESWGKVPPQLLNCKPQFLQRETDRLPPPLLEIVRNLACTQAQTPSINP